MDKGAQLLDSVPEASARVVALRALDEASAAAQRLRNDQDVEALHDFRVALRRYRSFLRGYGPLLEDSISNKRRRALRELAAGTTVARDTEVQLEWLTTHANVFRPAHDAAFTWLTDRLTKRHQEAYAGVRGETLRRFLALEPRLREGLFRYTAHLEGSAPRRTFAAEAGQLVRRAGQALGEGLARVHSPADGEAAHEARILAKRLRYLLEPLREPEVGEATSALVKHLKGLQDILGELHDAYVLADELAAAQVESATEHARRVHEALYLDATAEGQVTPPLDIRAGLLVIDRQVRDRIRELFDQLAAQWLHERFLPFEREVAAFSDLLIARGHRHLEIERKYLLANMPAFDPPAEAIEIHQGYLPGENVRERIRRVDAAGTSRFFRTMKMGSGLVRTELEDETDASLFERLWPLTEGRRVHKRRHRVHVGDRLWEVDEFLDRPLVLAEVELPSPDTTVDLPEWLRPHVVREVTEESDFKNEHLAR